MLHSMAADIGSVLAYHNEVNLLPISNCIKDTFFIPVVLGIQLCVGRFGLFLTGLFALQHRCNILGEFNRSDTVIFGGREIPVSARPGVLIPIMPYDLLPNGQGFRCKINAVPGKPKCLRNAQSAFIADQDRQVGTASLGKAVKYLLDLLRRQVDMRRGSGLFAGTARVAGRSTYCAGLICIYFSGWTA